MKSFLKIIVSFFCLNHIAHGQTSIGHFEIPKVREIILLYLDGKYETLDAVLNREGYQKSYVFPQPKGVSIDESFTYTNDTFCSETDIRIEVNRKNDVSATNYDYFISFVFYSSVLHENEEEHLKDFLKKYAYNAVESTATGSQGPPTKYLDTNTPESIKRNGKIYLWKVRTYILDGANRSYNFCGLRYRIKYDMYFRKGYASLDSIGYVSTKEGSDLRLRDGPSLSSTIITGIPDKSKIFIVEYSHNIDFVNGQAGNWYKIKYEGHVGWAWGNFIRKEREK